MRNNDLFNSFTDLSEHSWLRLPHIVVTAADISYRDLIAEADLYAAGEPRRVIYEDANNVKRYLELVPYIHPVGAGSFTIGTIVDNADGTRTYTPSQEGRLLGEDGALINAGSVAIDIAGLLFADYYYHFTDGNTDKEHGRVVSIGEGDFLWLVRNGPIEVDSTTAVTALNDVVVSETVAGECEAATAIDTTSAATLNTTIREHLTATAAPGLGECIGRALETTLGAGLVEVDLALGPRRFR